MLLMWVGNNVSGEFLQEVFNVPSLRVSDALNLELSSDMSRPTVNKIHQIVAQIRRHRAFFPPLYIIRQGTSNDTLFMHLMRDDRVENTMSHPETLAYVRSALQK